MMVDHVEPLFVEYSIFTLVTLEEVQVIFFDVPAVKDSAPFGEVTWTVAVGATAAIVNTALLWSITDAFEASLILTRHCADVGVAAGIVHV